ncbi:MAG: hypothetical protein AAF220_03385 [Pseudomonadota bacterium]
MSRGTMATGQMDWSSLRERRDREYRVCFMMTFPFFLMAALVMRLIPQTKPQRLQEGERRSVLAEARAMTNTSITHTFLV